MILVSYDSIWGFSDMLRGESHVFGHYVIIHMYVLYVTFCSMFA